MRLYDENYWADTYRNLGAFWEHSGNPSQPHVLLSGGGHSNGYFNSELVLQDIQRADRIARALLTELTRQGLAIGEVDRVVGPAMGAVTLVDMLSFTIARRRQKNCLRAFVEKEGDGPNKRLVLRRTELIPGEKVLVCEDVTTRVISVVDTARAVEEAGGVVLPFYGLIVNRSGLSEMDGRRLVALVHRHLPVWTPEECPLCKHGSIALRPKGKENWAHLNAKT